MPVLYYTASVRPDRSLELPPEAWGILTPGQEIEIGLEAASESAVKPNERALATLEKIARLQEGMRHTDGSQTNRFIREGRAGAMYGYEPTE